MRINLKQLSHFAVLPPFDRRGWLTKRAGFSKIWQRRYFVLKGNLFFYFEKPYEREPLGVIVLENFTVGKTFFLGNDWTENHTFRFYFCDPIETKIDWKRTSHTVFAFHLNVLTQIVSAQTENTFSAVKIKPSMYSNHFIWRRKSSNREMFLELKIGWEHSHALVIVLWRRWSTICSVNGMKSSKSSSWKISTIH